MDSVLQKDFCLDSDNEDLHKQDHAVWKMNNKAEESKWFLKHFEKLTFRYVWVYAEANTVFAIRG